MQIIALMQCNNLSIVIVFRPEINEPEAVTSRPSADRLIDERRRMRLPFLGTVFALSKYIDIKNTGSTFVPALSHNLGPRKDG
jgi:hypothetical protein